MTFDGQDMVYCCAKLNPRLKAIKDESVLFNEREAKKIGLPIIDFFDMHNLPHSDNCQGYLYLKHVPQGYDVKPP